MNNKPKLSLALWMLIKYLYTVYHNMPKEFKYSLGQDMLKSSWQCLDKVTLANALPNNKKAPTIKSASVVFDQLKYRLRMIHELEIISHKQYAHIIKQNEAIGKMLTGWLRWAQKQ